MGGIEDVVSAVESEPQFYELWKEGLLGARPLHKWEDLSEEDRTVFDVILEKDFAKPPEGMVNFYLRSGRVPRLADGTYAVFVPRNELVIPSTGEVIEIPPSNIPVEHKREYHTVAEFEPGLYGRGKSAMQMVEEMKDIERIGIVKKTVNIDSAGPENSTLFSAFRAGIPAPPGWDAAAVRMEEIWAEHIMPYLENRRKKIMAMTEKGESARNITVKIGPEDKAFVDKFRPELERFVGMQNIINKTHAKAVNRVLTEYSDMVYGVPFFVYTFTNWRKFAIDHGQRILFGSNMCLDKPITSCDISRWGYIEERFPFNEEFHKQFRSRILREPREYLDYEKKALNSLSESWRLLNGEFYSSAVRHAATGLEVMIKGFLIGRGVLSQDDLEPEDPQKSKDRQKKPSMKYMLCELFDDAIRQDPAYAKKSRIFSRRIVNKIISFKNQNSGGPTMAEIRNAEVHDAGFNGGNGIDPYTAHFAVLAYQEAVSYILNEGWLSNPRGELASEVIAWKYPQTRGKVPSVPPNASMQTMESVLRQALQYMDPREAEHLRKNTPKTSWAYDILNPSLE